MAKTRLHMVDSCGEGLELFERKLHPAGREVAAFDAENLLASFIGNHKTRLQAERAVLWDKVNMVRSFMANNPDVGVGIMSNNTNTLQDAPGEGLLSILADALGIPRHHCVHKDMPYDDRLVLGKPAGDQTGIMAEIFGVPPGAIVLFDDQPMKNGGEAVSGGMQDMIAVPPVGATNRLGMVDQHFWVRASRLIEDPVLASIERGGAVARFVMPRIAGVSPDDIEIVRYPQPLAA